MVYTVIATRVPGDAGDVLYPSVDAKRAIVDEPSDGGKPRWLAVGSVTVDDGSTDDELTPLPGDATDTDATVTAAPAGLAITNARVLLRDGDKETGAVGHLRYPWIQEIGYHRATGADDVGVLRFSAHLRSADGGVEQRVVTVRLASSQDARDLALSTAAKIADFRLATIPNLSDDKRWTLAKLRTPKKPARDLPGITSIRLPGSVHVSTETAIPGELH